MKTKLLTSVCVLALLACSVNNVRAEDRAASAAADALILRPLGLAATVIGGALFVISLPFTAGGGHIKHAAHTLVVVPGEATFKRPLGDFASLPDNSN